ncbi:SH3 domain-containing protein [Streptomyces sp. SA15]|uniref:SH3 domain-containing protein n=1 Tax=Streptomyces sp. SA15 TaxID=934019 RepID=UPI00117F4DBE|nr:SH3 domain-containing protein [Streptomyces sp. SA15]
MTPIGIFSVDAGVEHQFSVNPKGYLTAVFRYVKPKLGLVEAGYLIRTDHRIEPELDGQSLAAAQGGLLRVDATEAEPGEVTRLKISDVPQDTPVPTASASTCPGSGSTEVELPEVSAGDSVEDTVAELAAACLNVQYASEAADADEGTVSRVVVPTTVPGGEVQLPPADDGAPGPGDKVTTDERRVATVFVVAPPEEPSPTPTDTSASPTATATDTATPTDTTPPAGTTTVLGTASAPVRAEPSTAGPQVSSIAEGFTYDALCWQHGEEVTAHGRTSDVWIQLRRDNGETGWVTATAIDGDPETVVPALC